MDQQQQIAQGSLRSSHRNTHAIVFKKTNPKEQSKILDFLTNVCKDLIISQRINSSNAIGSSDRQNSIASYAEIPLKRSTFFHYSTTSKVEPGFLVFAPNSNPVFVKTNLSKKEKEFNKGQPICYTLRMRVSPEIYEGSVFIASLDGVNHSMTLEDVYVWKKKNIYQTNTFTERRKYMKEFVERHWIPDVRLLGGIITNIMNPLPLSSISQLKDTQDFTKVFLIPDAPGKRRFTFNLNETVAQIQNGYYGRKDFQQKEPSQPAQPAKPKCETPTTIDSTPKVAKAIKIPQLPDIYELYDLNGNHLNKAAVQSLELSKLLKEFDSEIQVKIKYNSDFNRYEIIGLNTPNIAN
jgi:hypothetical protein